MGYETAPAAATRGTRPGPRPTTSCIPSRLSHGTSPLAGTQRQEAGGTQRPRKLPACTVTTATGRLQPVPSAAHSEPPHNMRCMHLLMCAPEPARATHFLRVQKRTRVQQRASGSQPHFAYAKPLAPHVRAGCEAEPARKGACWPPSPGKAGSICSLLPCHTRPCGAQKTSVHWVSSLSHVAKSQQHGIPVRPCQPWHHYARAAPAHIHRP